mmetsp:Transcript_49344/g.88124  ORF Transcript_49344/g.88124 Transcript_49344/m.88124 type:complete len:211 (-) Transcript_49344:902-1534(-)
MQKTDGLLHSPRGPTAVRPSPGHGCAYGGTPPRAHPPGDDDLHLLCAGARANTPGHQSSNHDLCGPSLGLGLGLGPWIDHGLGHGNPSPLHSGSSLCPCPCPCPCTPCPCTPCHSTLHSGSSADPQPGLRHSDACPGLAHCWNRDFETAPAPAPCAVRGSPHGCVPVPSAARLPGLILSSPGLAAGLAHAHADGGSPCPAPSPQATPPSS